MVYQKIVKGLSGYISRELNLSDKEKDHIRFALEVLISTLLSLVLSLLVAGFLGIVKPVFFVILAGAALKASAGGIHLKSPLECALSTTFITNLLGLISTRYSIFLYENWVIILMICSLYILFSLIRWSPAGVPEKPIKDEGKRKQLKTISLFIFVISLLFITVSLLVGGSYYTVVSFSILGGLLFQSFAVSPTAYKLHSLYYSTKKQ